MWLNGFNEIGNALLRKTGNELRSIMVSFKIHSIWRDIESSQEEDDAKGNHLIQSATCKMYNFSCKASQSSFNVRECQFQLNSVISIYSVLQDQNRVRYGIMTIQPVDFAAESLYYDGFLSSPWAQ